jgi:hypothetical protein
MKKTFKKVLVSDVPDIKNYDAFVKYVRGWLHESNVDLDEIFECRYVAKIEEAIENSNIAQNNSDDNTVEEFKRHVCEYLDNLHRDFRHKGELSKMPEEAEAKRESAILEYPQVKDANLIGTYPALVGAGGGYVWDDVLEYRVWCHPERGATDFGKGDYYYFFATYQEALKFSEENQGTEKPLALVLQEEYIDEPEPRRYAHIKERRLTEWPVEFLSRGRRNSDTIPLFLSTNGASIPSQILPG